MRTGSDPQLAALAFLVGVVLVVVLAAVVALVRSGHIVPFGRTPRNPRR